MPVMVDLNAVYSYVKLDDHPCLSCSVFLCSTCKLDYNFYHYNNFDSNICSYVIKPTLH